MTILDGFILFGIPASVLILAWGSVLMFERGAAKPVGKPTTTLRRGESLIHAGR